MLGSLILVFALCTDTFVASLAYGANRVHVGWGKVALLNGICSGCLGLALGLGNVISSILPGDVTRIICFVSLFLLGFIKFLDYSIKAYINRHCCIRRNLSFSLSGLKVIVNIYGDPMAADVDGSQSLGWKEGPPGRARPAGSFCHHRGISAQVRRGIGPGFAGFGS